MLNDLKVHLHMAQLIIEGYRLNEAMYSVPSLFSSRSKGSDVTLYV